MDSKSYLTPNSPEYIDDLYQHYLSDSSSVEPGWRTFFEGFEFARTNYDNTEVSKTNSDEFRVLALIDDYRKRGHLFTKTNPVRTRRTYSPTLDFRNFGLAEADLDRTFDAGKEIGLGKVTLRQIIATLDNFYCRSIGSDYTYIRNADEINWIRRQVEIAPVEFSEEKKKNILLKLTEAVLFEKFIHNRFPGQKRFSVEGSESVIPGLSFLIEMGIEAGVRSVNVGMAHRGRLNVLANILHKPVNEIFTEFSGKAYDDESLLGDVKYHLGFTSSSDCPDRKCRITLVPNPSHLEAANPVVQGITKGLLNHVYENDYNKVLPILIHGDAAIAGQGIVYEILQMSELEPYYVGGTIHVVINNQIGFTTNYLESRSSTYCTDVAKVIQAPVFHVNGDDAEEVVRVFELAFHYRQTFHKDVFIDVLSYRKFGHNEGDEPRFTQPTLYKAIANHPNVRDIYLKQLKEQNIVSVADVKKMDDDYLSDLEKSITEANRTPKSHIGSFLEHLWKDYTKLGSYDVFPTVDTTISGAILRQIGDTITTLPNGKAFFAKARAIVDDRRKQILESHEIDWGTAEWLAYASLKYEGFPVRLIGQDSVRGTFSHRHAALTIDESEEKHCVFGGVDGAQLKIYNSSLSEYGALGFEYGYAFAVPKGLTIWEAQFGDFANGAQIIFDQFISSAEEKWNVQNGLTVFLPHGYEGQGSEHSSARIERFLTLAADNNMIVVNATTPSNLFHLLRRQVKFNFRKPLILFTPKSLLRHPQVKSQLTELSDGAFQPVIPDNIVVAENVKRVLLCSGKLYYELFNEREKRQDKTTAIVRVEQLYPFPSAELAQIAEQYKLATDWVWVQEEPGNMGPWSFVARRFTGPSLRVVCRPDMGSPATGSYDLHKIRQSKIIEKAFGECSCDRVKSECRMICSEKEWQFANR
ncbi:MAG: 2-oxoglutarate dehydrogenase E1 component [Bacteroidetes bacterium HGW-Bacteroidetes-6]|jgi:2-oxoglutarate dehydrogenase E1 component|nr:MAG: 2-oxoglutarate dehydrogenase E1 component [Bacteroidetes bacterium HGW-Bacteroidetes-6]